MRPIGSSCSASGQSIRIMPGGAWQRGAWRISTCRRAGGCATPGSLHPVLFPASSTAARRQQVGAGHHGLMRCSSTSQTASRHSRQQVALCSYPRAQRTALWHAQPHSRQPCSGRQRQSPRLAAASSSGGGQSVDDDEEGDSGATWELEAYEVERFRQMGRHLDLMWNVGKKPRPAPCDCCEGTGSRNCRYCNSTGAMMVGHERFCSLEKGCKPCPICNGTGEVKCSHCQGTGYRAGWLERGCPVEK